MAYSFDAGPNAVIFTLQQHVPEFVHFIQHFFPPETNGEEYVNTQSIYCTLYFLFDKLKELKNKEIDS